MKKQVALGICALAVVTLFSTACNKGETDSVKKEKVTSWDIQSSYEVNTNAKNGVPTVLATTESGKKVPASVEIFDKQGNAVAVVDGTFFVDAAIGENYRAVYYVEQENGRAEKETSFSVVDKKAPEFIVPQTEISVALGQYVAIDEYFNVTDNTEVASVSYTASLNGNAMSYDETKGFLADEGEYTFEITATDAHGNNASQTIKVTADATIFEFDDKAKALATVGHVYGARDNYPWYFHADKMFSYVEKSKLGAVAEGMREDAKGALYYDFSYVNDSCELNYETVDYRDHTGFMIAESYIPDYLTSIKVRAYLVAGTTANGETATTATYSVSPGVGIPGYGTTVPTNEWVEIEIPASVIYSTRTDFFGDTINYYSIGYLTKGEISAFYIDSVEIVEYALDKNAVRIGQTEYPDQEIDLTGFITLLDSEFEYTVTRNGVEIPLEDNTFIPTGAGKYTVTATAISGEYQGFTHTEMITVGGYSIDISFQKDKYFRNDTVVFTNEVFLDGKSVKESVSTKVYYGETLVSEQAFFKAEENGFYRIEVSLEANGKNYFSETVLPVGNIVVSYGNSKENTAHIERYMQSLDWNGGYRSEIQVKEIAESRSQLPENVASGMDSSEGALHIIRNGYLRYEDGSAPQYYAWDWHDIDAEVLAQGNTLTLNSSFISNVNDYVALAVKAYVQPKANASAKWIIYDQNDYSKDQKIKELKTGWNTLYITRADIARMLGSGWDRLPLGHFNGVEDMWISSITCLTTEEQKYSLEIVNTATEQIELKTFRYGEREEIPTVGGYTFVGYSLTEDGKDFVETENVKSGSRIYARFIEGKTFTLNEDVGSISIDVFKINNYYYWLDGVVQAKTTGMWKPLSAIDATIASGASDWSKGLLHLVQDGNYGTANDWTNTQGDVPDATNDVKGRSFYFRGLVTAADIPSACSKITVSIYVEAIAGTTAKYFDRTTNSYVTLSAGWNTINLPKSPITGEGYFYLGHFVNVQNLYIDYISVVTE